MTSINALDVPLFQPRKTDKADTYQQAVMRVLSDGAWHAAKSIVKAIPEVTTRDLRDIRKRARGAIIGSSKGYKLTRAATKEETDRYIRMCYKNVREYQQIAVHVENFRAKRRL